MQADDLVKMLFNPEEMVLPQEGPPQPIEESLSGGEAGRRDEL